MRQKLTRLLKQTDWRNLRSVKPISKIFGFDRGTPIDRYYIEKFLSQNSQYIKGNLLEIGSSEYCKRFGTDIKKINVLHATSDNPEATIIGTLTDSSNLPAGVADCFLCTQTFNVIYDFDSAIKGAYHMLAPNGIMLATVSGIAQISRYDMDRWGDYWRFTTLSALKALGRVFGEENIVVSSYGNVLASIALLEGIAVEELTDEELDYNDPDYQLLITIKAQKK